MSTADDLMNELLGDTDGAETPPAPVEQGPAVPTPSADDFLFGGGTPWVILKDKGHSAEGEIVSTEVRHQRHFETKQPLYWANKKPSVDGDRSNPVWELVITLACPPGFDADRRDDAIEEDDGVRELHAAGARKDAVAKAVRDAGQKSLAVGGRLKITRTKNHKPNVSKAEYAAVYIPPAA